MDDSNTIMPINLYENKYEKMAIGKKFVIPGAFRLIPNELGENEFSSPTLGRFPKPPR